VRAKVRADVRLRDFSSGLESKSIKEREIIMVETYKQGQTTQDTSEAVGDVTAVAREEEERGRREEEAGDATTYPPEAIPRGWVGGEGGVAVWVTVRYGVSWVGVPRYASRMDSMVLIWVHSLG